MKIYLKRKLPTLGFNMRVPQIEMANEVLDMIKNKKKCLIFLVYKCSLIFLYKCTLEG